MAEGGVYPWKIQKVEAFGPTADYSNLSKPLPSPPDGMVWDQDVTTKEWKLISSPEQKAVVPKNEENKETLNDDIDVLKQMAREEEKQKERQKSAGPTHIQHIILPTDTLAGICLKYKISAVKVRQINRFSGSNLHLAPNPLIIPIVDPQLLVDGVIKVQNTESREFKRGAFRARFLSLRDGEITSYVFRALMYMHYYFVYVSLRFVSLADVFYLPCTLHFRLYSKLSQKQVSRNEQLGFRSSDAKCQG
mmetsp:Transcript_34978/g.52842  ORF Transcript_34978/g.52842 Transcript_34978/m.52842 type:complete len:249 (+) Transcript_34978:94-840(+)